MYSLDAPKYNYNYNYRLNPPYLKLEFDEINNGNVHILCHNILNYNNTTMYHNDSFGGQFSYLFDYE